MVVVNEVFADRSAVAKSCHGNRTGNPLLRRLQAVARPSVMFFNFGDGEQPLPRSATWAHVGTLDQACLPYTRRAHARTT